MELPFKRSSRRHYVKPTLYVNGNATTISSSILDASLNFLAYLIQGGSVQAINMSYAEPYVGYTSASVAWNNDGGGAGLTLGTPVLATGLVSYAITNAGSGYTTEFRDPDPGRIVLASGVGMGDGHRQRRDGGYAPDREHPRVRDRVFRIDDHGHFVAWFGAWADYRTIGSRWAKRDRRRSRPAPD